MDRSKVSVIMPVYNSGKYLNKAIESVLSQTYEDFELVIVNDGSTDNSASICRKYAEKDKRIKFIDQKNKGVSAARNTALASVSGHNIAFVDSDDVIDKHFLEIMLREKEKSSAEIVMCSFERFSTDRPSFKDNNGAKTVTWNHDEALNNCYGAYGNLVSGILWNKIYDTELFNGIEFPLGLKNEDEFVLPKLVDKCKNMTYVDAILYYYYENGNSITTNAKYLASKDIYKVYDNRLEYFGNKGSAYAGFVNRTKKDYLDRIISRYKKSGSNELRSLYSEKYNAFKDNVSGVGYKIFKYSPALYFYLVKMKDKVS